MSFFILKHNFQEYVISVEQQNITWTIQKRYTEFRQLFQILHSNSGLDIEFPKKKMTGNKDRDFIVMRQNALQQFLNFITSHPILSHSVGLKNFIHPSLYSGNQQGILLIYLYYLCMYYYFIDNRVQSFVNFLLINY